MLDLAITHDNFPLRVQSNGALALVYREMGDHNQAVLSARQNVALLEGNLVYERFGRLALPSVSSRQCLAACLAELGDFTEGQTIGEEAVRIADTIDNPYNRVVALTNGVGLVASYKGDFTTAIRALEPSLALCQGENINLYLPLTASLLASTYAHAGRLAEAQRLSEQMEMDKTVFEQPNQRALVLMNLSEVKRLAGQLEASYTQIQEAFALARSRQERGYQAWCLRLIGELTALSDASHVEQAVDFYRQALTLANELGMRPLQAHCHRGLGALYSQTGQAEQARAELTTAIDMYRDMEMTFWLPETEAARAAVDVKA
jgi:tetratricopeptide (TPR) repeat protein